MNDISFSEEDFCIVFLVLGSMGILASGLLFFIQDLHGRRNRRMQILSPLLSPQPETWVSGDPGKAAALAAPRAAQAACSTTLREISARSV